MKIAKIVAVTAMAAATACAQECNSTLMWYESPAKVWTDALPVGNGQMGAMLFGGVERAFARVVRFYGGCRVKLVFELQQTPIEPAVLQYDG